MSIRCTIGPITPYRQSGVVIKCEATCKAAIADPEADVLFQGAIGRIYFPRGKQQDLIASIRENLLTLGDDIAFIPSHDLMSSFGYERESNPFAADARYD